MNADPQLCSGGCVQNKITRDCFTPNLNNVEALPQFFSLSTGSYFNSIGLLTNFNSVLVLGGRALAAQ